MGGLKKLFSPPRPVAQQQQQAPSTIIDQVVAKAPVPTAAPDAQNPVLRQAKIDKFAEMQDDAGSRESTQLTEDKLGDSSKAKRRMGTLAPGSGQQIIPPQPSQILKG